MDKKIVNNAKSILKNYKDQHYLEKRYELCEEFFEDEKNNYEESKKYCFIIRKSIDTMENKDYKKILALCFMDSRNFTSEFIADNLNISRRTFFEMKNLALLHFGEICPLVNIKRLKVLTLRRFILI